MPEPIGDAPSPPTRSLARLLTVLTIVGLPIMFVASLLLARGDVVLALPFTALLTLGAVAGVGLPIWSRARAARRREQDRQQYRWGADGR